jgi:hypothetical protein
VIIASWPVSISSNRHAGSVLAAVAKPAKLSPPGFTVQWM